MWRLMSGKQGDLIPLEDGDLLYEVLVRNHPVGTVHEIGRHKVLEYMNVRREICSNEPF